jgi:hypothetical protein
MLQTPLKIGVGATAQSGGKFSRLKVWQILHSSRTGNAEKGQQESEGYGDSRPFAFLHFWFSVRFQQVLGSRWWKNFPDGAA